MLNRILFVLLLSLSMVSDAFAEIKRVAVLEFRGVDIQPAILLKLSDQSRTAAVQVLNKDEYLIMTRENMMQILSDMGKDASCMEGQCEVEIGRNVGADLIVTGDILKIEGTYVLTLKLYDTLSGGLLHSLDVEDTSVLTLKSKTHEESIALFQKGLGLSGASSAPVNIESGFTGGSVQTDDWMVEGGNTAIVKFESNPSGAVVLVDGQMLCTTTPCSKEIKAGNHKVVFQKERYFPYESMVNAKTGSKVSGELEARFGHVSVSSSPSGVKVLLDGETFGSTPISRKEVDAGVHTLSIKDPCYVGQDYRFQMKPGGTESVTYPVSERQSAVKVTVMDKADVLLGDVYVDGTKVGQSSSVIKVALCSKELKVKVNDRTFTEKLNLQERQVSELSVDASGPGPVIKGVDYKAVLIPSGTFTMGCTSEQSGCDGDESPTHKVTLTRDFYMMESEVTQRLYQRVMNSNPSWFQGLDRPVEEVSWFDAVKFANKLSSMEGLEQCYSINGNTVTWSKRDCKGWRLPTEAEWEYAARGGQSYKYAGSNNVDEVAWYRDNSGSKTHDVCGKNRNGYGLCDMSGNVWEWVWDWYDAEYYSGSPTVDRRGPTSGSSRVGRGGGWDNLAQFVRVSIRVSRDPSVTSNSLGFRLARNSP